MSSELGKVYHDGEVIIRQGDVDERLYVVQEGRADITAEQGGREVFLRSAGPGEMLGEMTVFERVPRSATVTAVGDVRVLTLDKEAFLQQIHKDPSLVFTLLQTMSRRIRELSNRLARLG